MIPRQFVTCSDESCPFCEEKQCRSPFVVINEKGQCSIRESGPYDNKASTESYVEIRECQCQKCNHWEVDEYLNMGACGFRESLVFAQYKNEPLGPKCREFEKQIPPPGFAANNV
jgi:hypothetical protein